MDAVVGTRMTTCCGAPIIAQGLHVPHRTPIAPRVHAYVLGRDWATVPIFSHSRSGFALSFTGMGTHTYIVSSLSAREILDWHADYRFVLLALVRADRRQRSVCVHRAMHHPVRAWVLDAPPPWVLHNVPPPSVHHRPLGFGFRSISANPIVACGHGLCGGEGGGREANLFVSRLHRPAFPLSLPFRFLRVSPSPVEHPRPCAAPPGTAGIPTPSSLRACRFSVLGSGCPDGSLARVASPLGDAWLGGLHRRLSSGNSASERCRG
eukprot:scaffold431_cov334-Pavlova_lutheri.AAC.93